MIVETEYGQVQGVQEGEIFLFRGIPYAAPPVGNRRYMPPEPPLPWKGIRPAMEFGPIAPQAVLEFHGNGKRRQSEDCLTLNIWTPGTDPGSCSVLFNIHGGGFTAGTGAEADGSKFAGEDGIVYVSTNYRLGALGFLYLGDWLGESYRTSGNNGLLDLIAALRWVQDNIAVFGGDPGRVTIAGGSAGAKCVASLLTAPAAAGLFHGAIAQSGATQSVRDTGTAARLAARVLDSLGIRKEEACKLLELPTEAIVQAQDNGLHAMHAFGPVLDGAVIPMEPLEAIKEGHCNAVPLLLGTNKEEAALFTAVSPEMRLPNDSIISYLFGKNGEAVRNAFRIASSNQSSETAWNEVLTDCLYHAASIRLAEAAAERGMAVWLYRFTFENQLGAIHGFENGFVANIDRPLDLSSPKAKLFAVPPEGKPLANRMHAAWAAFVHRGSPQIPELPEWSRFTEGKREIMVLDRDCRMDREPHLKYPGFPNQALIL